MTELVSKRHPPPTSAQRPIDDGDRPCLQLHTACIRGFRTKIEDERENSRRDKLCTQAVQRFLGIDVEKSSCPLRQFLGLHPRTRGFLEDGNAPKHVPQTVIVVGGELHRSHDAFNGVINARTRFARIGHIAM